jgi:hypothetical protein
MADRWSPFRPIQPGDGVSTQKCCGAVDSSGKTCRSKRTQVSNLIGTNYFVAACDKHAVADQHAGAEKNSWTCGMCGHTSPARFRKKCQRCGAVKGMGHAWRRPNATS